jgi:hypothetical protein
MSTETKTDQPPALPTVAQIEALLRFLPVFGQSTSAHAEWHGEPGKFPWCELSEAATAFHAALYEQGFIIPFDWDLWQREASRYVHSPALLATADLRTLCQLMTLHARKNRFCEGHFACQLANGHMAAILQRLAAIRDESLRR